MHTESDISDSETSNPDLTPEPIFIQNIEPEHSALSDDELSDAPRTCMSPVEESVIVNIGSDSDVKEVHVGSSLSHDEQSSFIALLKEYVDSYVQNFYYTQQAASLLLTSHIT